MVVERYLDNETLGFGNILPKNMAVDDGFYWMIFTSLIGVMLEFEPQIFLSLGACL